MGSVEPYETKAGRRYRVRYRDGERRQTDKRGFRTKREAQEFLATVEVSLLAGEYVNPADARVTIDELGAAWIRDRKAILKPSTYHSEESTWRVHVQPRWGDLRIGRITHSEVQTWVSELAMTRSATTVKRAHGILAALLDAAVRDRRIARNVARDVRLPRKKPAARVYLSHEQVQRLAEASSKPELVYFLAYTGLRWSEAVGLRVEHVDMLRRRVHVVENAVQIGGQINVGTPKNHKTRWVPFPEFLSDPLARLCEGKTRASLLFGDGVTHLRRPHNERGWFQDAIKRLQEEDLAAGRAAGKARAEIDVFPRLTPHDLRHTTASLAVSVGANVKAVQQMLGHSSAAMTLDIYADLFDDDLEAVAVELNTARSNSVVGKMWANGSLRE